MSYLDLAVLYPTALCIPLYYDVMVSPNQKGKGIGTERVRMLVDKCISHNIRSIQLFAAEGTEGFYSGLGFVRRPDDAPGMKYVCT